MKLAFLQNALEHNRTAIPMNFLQIPISTYNIPHIPYINPTHFLHIPAQNLVPYSCKKRPWAKTKMNRKRQWQFLTNDPETAILHKRHYFPNLSNLRVIMFTLTSKITFQKCLFEIVQNCPSQQINKL